jgi:K+/H+ antiporter YhaU regulatory subunit KhtT
MALSRGQVNPLSALGVRKLTFIPEHFSSISVSTAVDIKLLDHWINYHLNSRYAIKRSLSVDRLNKVVDVTVIGIEDPREITMLSLGCPYLHNNKEDF